MNVTALTPGLGSALGVSPQILNDTFGHFRSCGQGHRECQVLWVGPWTEPLHVARAIHPKHSAHAGGFTVNDQWLHQFWLELARSNFGIRVQVHTHPHDAFHSPIDDTWPIVNTSGFLSLVIPDFGLGPIGLERSYLAEIGANGAWVQADPSSRIRIQQGIQHPRP